MCYRDVLRKIKRKARMVEEESNFNQHVSIRSGQLLFINFSNFIYSVAIGKGEMFLYNCCMYCLVYI